MKYLALAVLLLGVVACGDSPTSPADSSISGTWSGSILTSSSGLDTVTLSLAQTGSTLSGSWSSLFPNPAINSGGQVSGLKSGISVNVTMLPSQPTACPFTFTATLSNTTTMSGTYAAVNCTLAISGTLTLYRQ